MKRFLLFAVLTWLCAANTADAQNVNGKTYYYRQINKVVNGQKSTGNGSGQFITFNNKGCYDSDSRGYTVNNGFLKFGKSTAERMYYSGGSYWGDAMYIFTENYNRLNIVVDESSTTYVYVRDAPPAGTTTCALIRKTGTSPAPNPVVVNPIKPDRTPTSKQKYVTREESCPQCYSSGKCSTCYGKGYLISIYTQKYDDCVNCTNGKCTKCGGSGKVLKGRYETVYE